MTDSQPSTTHRLLQWLGLQQKTIDLKELIVAAAGSVIAITVVFFVSDYLPHGDHLLIVASTGASAVLIFAVPHGRLSQPWPVIAGHCVCATIGVAFAQWIGTGPETAALTVGACIVAMSLCRCVHPPAGATALTAVLGGSEILELGYLFVLSPVLINMLTLVGIAILLNLPFRSRQYPVDRPWRSNETLG